MPPRADQWKRSETQARIQLFLPFVRTKGNQKPPAVEKMAKLYSAALKENKAPRLSEKFESLLSGPVSFLTLHYAAVLNAIFPKAGKIFPNGTCHW